VRLPILRGATSFVLVLVGIALLPFSVVAAFGWGHKPTSFGGIVIAILALLIMFGGYWIIRDMDGALLAAVCLRVALGVGSTFLVVGLPFVFLGNDLSTPTGYFIAVGCLCILGWVKFRAYTKDR
jgi:hypothetical protein